MSGFMGGDAAGIAATWVAAIVTLVVWSYLFGERRLFRLAQLLLAGLATGFLVVLAARDVLLPRLVEPLVTNPAGNPLLVPAAGMVIVMAGARWLPRASVAIPVAVLVAGTAAFALGGAVVGTLLPQLAGSVLEPGATPLGLLNGVVGLVISVLVLLTFLHGVPRSNLGVAAAGIGRWLLLGGIGGWLGFLIVSRLALLVDRLGFLLGDWLGMAR